MIVIAVRELHKYFGENHVLKGVTLEIGEGQRVAIVGKNGSGKTTLFKVLEGTEGYEEGSISITRGKQLSLLDQIPSYPPDYSVMDVLMSAFEGIAELKSQMEKLEQAMALDPDPQLLKRYGVLQADYEARDGYTADGAAARVCVGLGIGEEIKQKPFNLLSGGEQTRVNLGRVILQERDILLLDEPTNHLDIKSLEWLEEYLLQYKGTVVAISHDRYFLDRVANRVIELEDGRAAVYEGNYSWYVREKEERYQAQLARFMEEEKKVRQLEEAAKRMHEWAKQADSAAMHRRAFSIEKRIERMERTEKPKKTAALTASFERSSFSGNEVATLDEVSKAYGDKILLQQVDLCLNRSDRVALLGDNGCGKTTLLKLLTGELLPDGGSLKLGDSIRYAFLPQVICFDNPERSLMDTVRYELETSEERARSLLAAFHFPGPDIMKPVGKLSGGEKSRLKLCLLMQQQVNLLILDEPTNHLDICSREWIEEAVEGFQGTLLFVSHDRYFINRFANRIWELNQGIVQDFDGTYTEYREWQAARQKEAEKPVAEKKAVKPSRKAEKKVGPEETCTQEAVEEEISRLESRLKEIDEEMERKSSEYSVLEELLQQHRETSEQVEQLYRQWAALEA